DIDAVADRQGLERFALVGISAGAAPAIAYAVRHPERVSRLGLLDPLASGEAWARFRPLRRMLVLTAGLAEDDWESFTRAAGSVVTGFDAVAEARTIAANLARSASPHTFLRYESAMKGVDLSPVLPHVAVPALVLHNHAFPVGSLEM